MSRFYFDLSLTSSRDWRISHGLSHHFYTNMHLDIEVAVSIWCVTRFDLILWHKVQLSHRFYTNNNMHLDIEVAPGGLIWSDFISTTLISTLRCPALNPTASTSSLFRRSLFSLSPSLALSASLFQSSSSSSKPTGDLEEGLAARGRPSCCFPHFLHAVLWQNVPCLQGWSWLWWWWQWWWWWWRY